MLYKKHIAITLNEYLNEKNLNNNFWKWFDDSKIFDNDKPLICYHGTNNKNIKEFDLDFTGKNTDSGMFGKGFYFSDNIKESESYNRGNGEVLKVYLRIINPLIINDKKDIPEINVPGNTIEDLYNASEIYSELFREYLIKNDYDGVIDNLSINRQFVVLYPNQIKSIDNDGSWDINDNNIYS